MRPAPVNKRRQRFWLAIAGVILFAVSVSLFLSGAWVGIVAGRCFDHRITPELIATVCGKEVPFAFSSLRHRSEIEYSASFRFATADPEIFTSITIVVAPAGRYLKRSEYEREKAKTVESDSHQPAEMRWAPDLFPDIGRRALVDMVLSPNGGGGTVTFTTSDGWFDISVSQSNHLRDGLPILDLDIVKIARMISLSYDKGA